MAKIIVRVHSVVDIITNSSSELFVGKSTKDVETVKELLQKMLDVSNEASGISYSFSDCFQEPRRIKI